MTNRNRGAYRCRKVAKPAPWPKAGEEPPAAETQPENVVAEAITLSARPASAAPEQSASTPAAAPDPSREIPQRQRMQMMQQERQTGAAANSAGK